jgi:hypothetical protein
MDLDIVGLKELAVRLGVRQQTAAVWRYRGLLPPEEGVVSGAPCWQWGTIENWAKQTGRIGGVAEFVQDRTPGWRVIDQERVEFTPGVVVRQVSQPFPQPLTNGQVQTRVRIQAADGQWYELTHEDYKRGIGAGGNDRLAKVVLAAGAAALGIIVINEASKGGGGSGPGT